MICVTTRNPETQEIHRIKFVDQLDKEQYIKREFNYCLNEINQAMTFTKDKRKSKYELFHKRMEFLVRNHYHKTPGNIWVKRQEDIEKELA